MTGGTTKARWRLSTLTGRGTAVLLGSTVALLIGIALGYRAVVVPAGAVVILSMACGVAVRKKPSLDVERLLGSERVERGQTAAGGAKVTNRGRTATPRLVLTDDVAGVKDPVVVPKLQRGETSSRTFYIPTSRRGRLTIGPMVIVTGDPLGLAEHRVDFGQVKQLIVQPRVTPVPDVRRSLLRSVDGPESQSNIEGTLAFHTLREYVPGDDLRHVHWRSSARGTALLVKQHVDTARPAMAIVCDDVLADDGHAVEHFDVLIDCAASFAASALRRGQPVWLHSGAGGARWFRTGVGDPMTGMLDVLTDLSARPAATPDRTMMLSAAMSAASAAGPGSLAVVVTSRAAAELPARVNSLAESYAVTLVVHPHDTTVSMRHGRVWHVGLPDVERLPELLLGVGLFA